MDATPCARCPSPLSPQPQVARSPPPSSLLKSLNARWLSETTHSPKVGGNLARCIGVIGGFEWS